jgi:hypothetical protein
MRSNADVTGLSRGRSLLIQAFDEFVLAPPGLAQGEDFTGVASMFVTGRTEGNRFVASLGAETVRGGTIVQDVLSVQRDFFLPFPNIGRSFSGSSRSFIGFSTPAPLVLSNTVILSSDNSGDDTRYQFTTAMVAPIPVPPTLLLAVTALSTLVLSVAWRGARRTNRR